MANDWSKAQQLVALWNRAVPMGTPVRYYPIRGEDEHRETTTRSEAWVLSGHTPVVMIAGQSGCVHLEHCEVIEAAENGE